ncbi:MAG: hypothetical protein J0H99_21315, partial [Rhodospirillales bacterium]|nr:hypothetical protein [Rhodospirillales bacterium]
LCLPDEGGGVGAPPDPRPPVMGGHRAGHPPWQGAGGGGRVKPGHDGEATAAGNTPRSVTPARSDAVTLAPASPARSDAVTLVAPSAARLGQRSPATSA